MTGQRGESVPKAMQERYDEIVALTDAFCAQYLNEEYAALSRQMAAKLARKRPSPLPRGWAKSWAAAIVYAIGRVNFLFDASQSPHIAASDLADRFGVAQSTAGNKSGQILDMLNVKFLDPKWTLPSRVDDNPMVWLISVNGFLVDARYVPREIQEIAYQKGLIPYIPGEKPE
jgi:hypothetical protein